VKQDKSKLKCGYFLRVDFCWEEVGDFFQRIPVCREVLAVADLGIQICLKMILMDIEAIEPLCLLESSENREKMPIAQLRSIGPVMDKLLRVSRVSCLFWILLLLLISSAIVDLSFLIFLISIGEGILEQVNTCSKDSGHILHRGQRSLG
jgi:hypothetical protein